MQANNQQLLLKIEELKAERGRQIVRKYRDSRYLNMPQEHAYTDHLTKQIDELEKQLSHE